jgi:hypothetical protein
MRLVVELVPRDLAALEAQLTEVADSRGSTPSTCPT